jgi:peptide deformylase
MTKEEKELTYNGKIDEPFRVLITANEEDSLLLRKKSTDIENVENIANDKDWQFFIERLKLTMAVESGVGISAVQVGVLRNLFLFMRLDKPEFPVEVAINPRIVAHSPEEICFEDDGCLSIPGESADSRRYAWIDVEYYNEKGELIKERLSGVSRQGDFTGIVFQHEYDHLQGVLYIDKIWNE